MKRDGIKMKKGIIIYKSKYGAAKKYAEWLNEITGFDCVEVSKASLQYVKQFEQIILCGGIYASGIAGLSFIRKNIRELKDKKIAIFCVGASPYDKKAFEELKVHNLRNDLKDIPIFYGRGAWDESSMTFKDRTLCKLLQKSLTKKDPDTYEPWMKALMSAVGKSCDGMDKKYLKDLIEYLK